MRVVLCSLLGLFCLLLSGPADAASTVVLAESADAPRLVKVVALVRHGVRAPTQTEETLTEWSTRPWPRWPVQRGRLTPRGARLVSALWEDLRGEYVHQGLLPDAPCPPAASVFVRADTSERTRASARALLDGLAPGCGLTYTAADARPDPLFHPLRAGLCEFDPAATATDILRMTDGGLERLQEEFGAAVSLVDSLSAPPAPQLCARYALPPQCRISDLPASISISAEGRNAGISGGLGIASSLAEIFLLEYGQWPATPAGWGQVDGKTLQALLPVHSAVFDVINRAPVVARAKGSSLLLEMTAALQGNHYDSRLNTAALTVFVGHDTNIANIGGLLDMQWQAQGYPPNAVPPGSGLFFELWQHTDKKEVRVRFYAQSPEALHTPFDDEQSAGPAHFSLPKQTERPIARSEAAGRTLRMEKNRPHAPGAVTVSVPPVVGQARFALEDFTQRVRGVISEECMAPQQFARPDPVPIY